MHRTVSFLCAQPIEWGYDDRGDPVRPGGKALTEEIAASLAAAKCHTSNVEQHEDFGWGFSASWGDDAFYHVLNAVERDVYFTIKMHSFLMKRLLLRRPEVVFERYCGLVSATVAAIPGVSEVVWKESGR